MTDTTCDLLIAGTGPAGMTAALYGQRLGLKTVVYGDIPGGNLYMVEKLSNYPGFTDGIAGMELGVKMFQQAQAEGAQFTMSRLKKLQHGEGLFQAIDVNGQAASAATAIIATGRVPVRLATKKPNLKGVNFCSVCDGPLYRNQHATLAVVGSDNTAAQHAITLARIADKVTLIYRSAENKMDAAHAALVAGQKNIEILGQTEVVGYKGLDLIEAVEVRSGSGETREIPIDGVFLAIGWRPNTEIIDFTLEKTSDGYLKTDSRLMTSTAGFFAAGDVRDTDLWQVLTACADGARAAKSAAEYMAKITAA
ncbi:MAG: NAD(P)/FAD-dependent oxidoreductase [Desulfobacterales bacterium]